MTNLQCLLHLVLMNCWSQYYHYHNFICKKRRQRNGKRIGNKEWSGNVYLEVLNKNSLLFIKILTGLFNFIFQTLLIPIGAYRILSLSFPFPLQRRGRHGFTNDSVFFWKTFRWYIFLKKYSKETKIYLCINTLFLTINWQKNNNVTILLIKHEQMNTGKQCKGGT